MVGGEFGSYREVSTGANQHGLRRLEGVVLASSWPPLVSLQGRITMVCGDKKDRSRHSRALPGEANQHGRR